MYVCMYAVFMRLDLHGAGQQDGGSGSDNDIDFLCIVVVHTRMG